MAMKPVRVSQVNGYVRRILQSDPILSNISVIGEISNLKYHGSGHVYFSLKDDKSRLSCFLPADAAQMLRYELEDGMEIVADGYMNVYEKGGIYSLNIRNITVEGAGDLAVAFQKLKRKLEAEGLFDPQYKKSLPRFPGKIAVLTSETGAAVRDILKIIQTRNHCVDVLVIPTLVQGSGAAADIAAGIACVNRKFPDVDCMIVGRGGGSAEELWAFNEEVVARSIFASEIPVISAVGHETDFTIADYVADVRAETPTAAAQLAVPDAKALQALILEYREQMVMLMHRRISHGALRLKHCETPVLYQALKHREAVAGWKVRTARKTLSVAMGDFFQRREQQIRMLKTRLEAMDPQAVLKRGYAILQGEDGSIVSSASDAAAGSRITARLRDGEIDMTVLRKKSL